MTQLHVGWDLDGVFYSFEAALRSWLIENHGRHPDSLPTPVLTWDWWETHWGLDLNDFLRICGEATDAGHMFLYGEPFAGSVEAIVRVHEAGHLNHIITARNFGTKSPHNTADWLERWAIPYDSLCFTHHKGLTRPDVMVDDRPENFWAYEEAGVPVYLLDQPWNQQVNTDKRIYTLSEYADIVLEMGETA